MKVLPDFRAAFHSIQTTLPLPPTVAARFIISFSGSTLQIPMISFCIVYAGFTKALAAVFFSSLLLHPTAKAVSINSKVSFFIF
jgi:hypothetical protein